MPIKTITPEEQARIQAARKRIEERREKEANLVLQANLDSYRELSATVARRRECKKLMTYLVRTVARRETIEERKETRRQARELKLAQDFEKKQQEIMLRERNRARMDAQRRRAAPVGKLMAKPKDMPPTQRMQQEAQQRMQARLMQRAKNSAPSTGARAKASAADYRSSTVAAVAPANKRPRPRADPLKTLKSAAHAMLHARMRMLAVVYCEQYQRTVRSVSESVEVSSAIVRVKAKVSAQMIHEVKVGRGSKDPLYV